MPATMASSTCPTSRPAGLRRSPLLLLAAGLTASALLADEAAEGPSLGALKQLSVEQLMDIEVTSVSKQPEKLLDAPSAIQVVTGEDIARFGASSIPEALQLADNLDVDQKNSHDWAISARGFNTALGNKLLVLMDGRTLYTPLFSGVFWDAQNYLLEDIDHIEVISGPGGTLWGANAVNGVINITTKSAQDTQGLYAEAGGGSQLQEVGGVRYGGTLAPGVYYRVYGEYQGRGDEVLPDGDSPADSWHTGQGGFRVDAGGGSPNTLTLQGDAYGSDEYVETGGVARASGENLLGRWSHASAANDSNFSLQAYFDHTYLADPIPGSTALILAPAGILTDGLDTYDLDFQHHFSLGGQNHVVWGLGYRFTRDLVVNAPGLAFFPATLNQNLYSSFVQDEIGLAPELFLTVGSKLEHNDYTGYEVEPNARLRWDLSKKQMFWAAVSRAVRAPSRVDRDEEEPNPATPKSLVLIEGSPDFVSEKVVAYELGYRAQLGAKASAGLSTFYNDYHDVRSTSFTPRTLLPLFFANNLHGETHGLEFSGTYQALDWWQLRAGYDLLKENIGVKAGAMDINDALNETADPEHQASLSSSMNLPDAWTLDGRLRYVDTLHLNSGATVGTVPAYCELNVHLGWQPAKHLELSLVGQNLLHPEHVEYGFPGAAREEIARGVYGKAIWRY